MNEQGKKPRRRVKKIKGHGGHHGGSWKVAYADFVTAMMALFMVLWLVSQGDQKLKQAIASYFRSPGVFDTMRGGILGGPAKVSKEPTPLTSKDDEQALYSTAALLQQKFSTRPEFSNHKDQIKIEVSEEGLRIQIVDKAEKVSFQSGSASMDPEAETILKEIAQGVCGLPNSITIGGHTDRLTFPEGSAYTNWELSADRANAARRVLVSSCVRPEQISRIVGYADTQLLYPNEPTAPGNRRITITVLRQQTDEPAAGGAQKSPAKTDRETVPADGKETGRTEGKNEAPAAQDNETLKAKARLKSEGRVSIGTPDELPAGVRRQREPPKSQSAEDPGVR
jgi:chemotaxis protein MotB